MWGGAMFLTKKIEVISFKDFMSRSAQIQKKIPHKPMYGLMGVDITGHNMFSNFNAPYLIVFGAVGIILISTLIEHILISKGYQRQAETLDGFTKLMFPIGFYAFLFYGIVTVL